VIPALLLVLSTAFIGACASPTVDTISPEIPRNKAGEVLPVIVELNDYRGRPSTIVFILTNPAGTERLRRLKGRLPVTQKQVTDERMGKLIAFMRYQGFFDHARPAGNPPAQLPAGVRRTVSAWIGDGAMKRMLDVRGMAKKGRRDEVLAISEISSAIINVSNQTLTLKIDPGGRSAEDFLRQPGLKRGGGNR
jgi:hypothetical protein